MLCTGSHELEHGLPVDKTPPNPSHSSRPLQNFPSSQSVRLIVSRHSTAPPSGLAHVRSVSLQPSRQEFFKATESSTHGARTCSQRPLEQISAPLHHTESSHAVPLGAKQSRVASLQVELQAVPGAQGGTPARQMPLLSHTSSPLHQTPSPQLLPAGAWQESAASSQTSLHDGPPTQGSPGERQLPFPSQVSRPLQYSPSGHGVPLGALQAPAAPGVLGFSAQLLLHGPEPQGEPAWTVHPPTLSQVSAPLHHCPSSHAEPLTTGV